MIQHITMAPVNTAVTDKATITRGVRLTPPVFISHSSKTEFAFKESQTIPRSQVPPTLPSVK